MNRITRAAWMMRARSSGVIEPRSTMPSSVASVLLMRKSCGPPIFSFSLFFTIRSQDVADGDGLGERIIRVLLPAGNGRGVGGLGDDLIDHLADRGQLRDS